VVSEGVNNKEGMGRDSSEEEEVSLSSEKALLNYSMQELL